MNPITVGTLVFPRFYCVQYNVDEIVLSFGFKKSQAFHVYTLVVICQHRTHGRHTFLFSILLSIHTKRGELYTKHANNSGLP